MAIISRICILSCVTLEILAFPNMSKRLNQDFYDLLEEEAEDFKKPSNTVYGGLKSGGGKFEISPPYKFSKNCKKSKYRFFSCK